VNLIVVGEAPNGVSPTTLSLRSGTTMELDPRIQNAVVAVVNTQIDSNDPPETGLTFLRLVNEGYTPEEAKDLIGCVVLSEVFDVIRDGEKFNLQRYVTALNCLPAIPENKI